MHHPQPTTTTHYETLARHCGWLALFILLAPFAWPAAADTLLDEVRIQQARAAVAKGIIYLRQQQQADGSWSPNPGPAITALAVQVLLDDPATSLEDPAFQKAVTYILGKRKPDGGIHDGFLENYNTSICLSALGRLRVLPQVGDSLKPAQDYLRQLQWAWQTDPAGRAVDESHPFFGGAGYGQHGRPDMSNTQIMIQGLHDSGLRCDDPAYQRALVFITRCQGTASNTEFGDMIVPDGGFIYATSVNKDAIGQPQSMAGAITMEDGTSRLATYGSMTYAGFKSYLYAELNRNDPRVQDAYRWITRHYTLKQNPGLRDDPATPTDERMQGYYYYLHTFARAMEAWGETTLTLADGSVRNWRVDLIDQLLSLQRSDGSWANQADRWMEGDTTLVTCYALLALQYALK